ncbi:quinol monooxygenase YgiN [Sphingomonas aquatilis]|uniref:Quinol monooxygenase YgiN n=1 Tax=Sphingomonas aquatilis TaxID=93063 RepID=A0AAW3TV04_9SPHN|nr:quinol monooxygenase YgiN [Sphingomonas aquatilis]
MTVTGLPHKIPDSPDAVTAHRATPHFQNYLSQIGDLAERATFVLNPVSAT